MLTSDLAIKGIGIILTLKCTRKKVETCEARAPKANSADISGRAETKSTGPVPRVSFTRLTLFTTQSCDGVGGSSLDLPGCRLLDFFEPECATFVLN